MGESGKKDKDKREDKKAPKQTLKEKRKEKKDKKREKKKREKAKKLEKLHAEPLRLAAASPSDEEPGTEEAVSKILDLRDSQSDFSDGAYPYKKKMGLQEYEEQKHLLQIELLKMQNWVKETGGDRQNKRRFPLSTQNRNVGFCAK